MRHVSAAIIRRQGKILICRRMAGGSCSRLWEFPGGKVQPEETEEQCAVRECREELAITIQICGEYARTSYSYPDGEIAFVFFDAKMANEQEEPNAIVHEEIRWVSPAQLERYTFCPADTDVLIRLTSEETRDELIGEEE